MEAPQDSLFLSGQAITFRSAIILLGVLLSAESGAFGQTVVSDFDTVRPLIQVFGSWFYLNEFPLLNSFTDGSVKGQETISVTPPGVPGVSPGVPTVSGGASAEFSTSPINLAEPTSLELTARLGPDNAASEILVVLHDTDGTAAEWHFPVTAYNQLTFTAKALDWSASTLISPGSDSFLNLDRIGSLDVEGNSIDGSGQAAMFIQFDSLTVLTVPEPAYFCAAFGVALLGLAVWRHRL